LKPFDFDKPVAKESWIAQGLIPSKMLTFIVAKSGAGKSMLAENLAVCSVYRKKFLGKKTKSCPVLLINQDTPDDTLARRLKAFAEYLESKGFKRKHKLYVESNKGYQLSDGSLLKRIQSYKTPKLVIVDCLNSVIGKADVNSTRDMAMLPKFKSAVIGSGKTLVIIHHISEHANVDIDKLMTTPDTNRLTMGNSIINQQADTLIYLASKHGNPSTRFYIRVVGKRVASKQPPFVAKCHFNPEEGKSYIAMNGLYEHQLKPLNEPDKDILRLFREHPKDRGTYQVIFDMNSKWGKHKVRTSLKKLAKLGLLVEHRIHDRLFLYGLPERKKGVKR
jgi:hypothetical protein